MRTPAYILGALDALVKTGEVSPVYAAGVADVLAKSAGLWWDSSAQDYANNYNAWLRANPSRVRKDGTVDIRPDEATALVDKSRNWYQKLAPKAGWGGWAKNMWGRATRWLPGKSDYLTSEYYDREYNDMANRRRADWLKRYNLALHPEVAGAVQDAHVRDAGFRVQDAKHTMSKSDREAAGLTDDYANTFKTRQGDAAIGAKLYKPQFDKPTPASPYGKNLPHSYGTNSHMFYRVGYNNPLDQS